LPPQKPHKGDQMSKTARRSRVDVSREGSVGDNIIGRNSQWSFGGSVAETFSAHVRRSVPLYDEGHALICQISDYFISEGSTVYDLGTSTGELLGKLAVRHETKRDVTFIGIDQEEGMIAEARRRVGHHSSIRLEVGDITRFEYEPCDLIIACFTIQFVRPRVRQELINAIYQNLNWGGGFLMFEKIRAPDARFQDLCTGIYTDFKLENGFSEAEIINKARSLKGVLEPFSTEGNIDLMRRAGFVDIMTVIKYVPFEGFLAIK